MELIDIINFCVKHDCTVGIGSGIISVKKVVHKGESITSIGDKAEGVTSENFQDCIQALLERFELFLKQ